LVEWGREKQKKGGKRLEKSVPRENWKEKRKGKEGKVVEAMCEGEKRTLGGGEVFRDKNP